MPLKLIQKLISSILKTQWFPIRFTGEVKTLNEDGTGSIAITFNGVSKDLPITYTVDGLKIEVKGVMDLALWNAQKGIDALNEECKTLHAGADGKTKLWPTVDIVISTVLKKG